MASQRGQYYETQYFHGQNASVACFLVCKITNQLLLATSSASLQVWAGLVSRAWVG